MWLGVLCDSWCVFSVSLAKEQISVKVTKVCFSSETKRNREVLRNFFCGIVATEAFFTRQTRSDEETSIWRGWPRVQRQGSRITRRAIGGDV